MTKLVLCSGKVYYDIATHEERASASHIAVVRVELLYPFPELELARLMESYPNLERVVWVQEEPRNMGARAFMRRRMAGSCPSASHTTTSAASCAPPRARATPPPTSASRRASCAWRSTSRRIGWSRTARLSGRPCNRVRRPPPRAAPRARRGGAAGWPPARRAGQAADDGHRPLRVDALGNPADVVVGHVDRAGDVARVPFVALAHVEYLQLAGALAQPRHVDALDPLDRGRSSRQLVMPPRGSRPAA